MPRFAIAIALALGASCSYDGAVFPDAILVCELESQCPDGLVCTDARRCLPAADSSLVLLGAEPFAPNALNVRFEQAIGGAPTRASFLITGEADGETLAVLGAEVSETDPRVVNVFTNIQIPGRTYELRVFGLVSPAGRDTPDSGLSTLFTGYIEPQVSRSLAFFGPSAVVQGEPFEISVLARNDEDLSAFVDMTAELHWSLSNGGTVEVIDSPGWDQGAQLYTLILQPDPPIPDGEAVQVTLSASTRDGSSIDGTTEIFELRGAVTLELFEFVTPPFAEVNVPFEIMIRARGTDGRILEGFGGPVNLGVRGGTGTLTPNQSPSFVNGEATLNVQYDTLNPALQIEARTNDGAQISSLSPEVEVGLTASGAAAPTLTAVSMTTERVRLDWTLVPEATRYVILVSVDEGPFEEVTTVASGIYTFDHNNLENGSTYRYRVEARREAVLLAEMAARVLSKEPTLMSIREVGAPFVLRAEDSPYYISNPDGGRVVFSSSLVVEAGVVVLFPSSGGIELAAGSSLVVDGSKDRPVHFTAAESNVRWSGLWLTDSMQGATFAPGTVEYQSGSRVSHLIVDYASDADHAMRVEVPLEMEGLLFRHNRPGVSTLAINLAGFDATLRDSRFIQNERSVFDLEASSNLFMENNAWLFNASERNGAAWFATSPTSVNTAWLSDRGSLYFFNESGGSGGAFDVSGDCRARVADSVFIHNLSRNHGGAVTVNSYGEISNCRFEDNIALGVASNIDGIGGALFMVAGGPVTDSVFLNNRGKNGGALGCTTGGISASNIYAEGNHATIEAGATFAKVSVEHSTLINNSAVGSSGASALASGYFRNNYCAGNQGERGGCLQLAGDLSGPVEIVGNSMVDNEAGDDVSWNFFNRSDQCDDITLDGIYFGESNPGAVSECTSHQFSIVNRANEPWPLCLDAPEDPSCVGATIRP